MNVFIYFQAALAKKGSNKRYVAGTVVGLL